MRLFRPVHDSAVPACPLLVLKLLEAVVCVVSCWSLSYIWQSSTDAYHRLVEVLLECFAHAIDFCLVVDEFYADVQRSVLVIFELLYPVLLRILG